VIQLPLTIANLCLETDFLPALQLHDATVVNHQLDDTKPDPAERVPQGIQDGRGEIEIVSSGLEPGIVVVERRTQSHCSI
jgi:hypothetical protein